MALIEIRVMKRWRHWCLDCGTHVPEGAHIPSWQEAHHQVCETKTVLIPHWSAHTETTIRRGAIRIRDLDEPGWYS